MNTVRIVKSDADVYQAGRTYVDITECYAIKDTIPVTSNWTAEEVAVLVGLDLDEIGVGYAIHLSVHKRDKTLGKVKTLTEFIRLHIQAKIQEGK